MHNDNSAELCNIKIYSDELTRLHDVSKTTPVTFQNISYKFGATEIQVILI